ncbi:MAG: hypothetical protein KKB59_18415 [Spirochaetes bacterium]|nr:hypothetical protein [Spirochaetota bacterium]
MAVELIRGCGYRKVGGTYLCGECISAPCDRMPFPLTVCPVCGQGIKVSRGFTQVNPYRLWGRHQDCKDNFRPCFLCDPKDEPAYIMLVGAGNYKTPGDFLEEARQLGISKRIPFIPKGLELGKTVIYLAHPRACEVKVPAAMQEAMAIVGESETEQPRLLEAERNEKKLGIFCAFIPQRVEKLIKESEATPETIEALKKRNITAIPVPDDDPDHN